jgi:hypothetical protein
MLSQLIYSSRSTHTMSYAQLRDINETAVRINSDNGLTGLLVYGQSCFLQILEGDRADISATYLRIAGDPRHTDLVLIDVSTIAGRSFPEWAMRAVMLDGVNAPDTTPLLLKYSGSTRFQPALYTDTDAHDFLEEFSREFTPRVPG